MSTTVEQASPLLLEQAVCEICRVLERCEALDGVRVVTHYGPPFTELMRLQRLAQRHYLVMVVAGPAEIYLRRRRIS